MVNIDRIAGLISTQSAAAIRNARAVQPTRQAPARTPNWQTRSERPGFGRGYSTLQGWKGNVPST